MVRGKAQGAPDKPRQGRKKKNKGAEPAANQEQAPAAELPKAGHNSGELTDEQRASLTLSHSRKYDEALKAKKAAANAFLKVCKQAKADLGDDAIDDIKDILLIKEDADAFKARMDRQAKVARWMALPIGAEPSLFGEDRMPAVDRAFEEGKRAGSEGEARRPPYDTSVPQYARWMDGYDVGQTALMTGFKRLNPDTPLEAAVAEKTAADGEPTAADASDGLPRGSVPANGASGDPWPDDEEVKDAKLGTAAPTLRVVE